MSGKVIVFDFDGTLIDSNQLKYDAFFELFPDDFTSKQVVKSVLDRLHEESRYIILREILLNMRPGLNNAELTAEVSRLADSYNDLVLEGSMKCREMKQATTILKHLSRKYSLFVSSGTPYDALIKLIKHRGWTQYFKGIYGYPNRKNETLMSIMKSEGVGQNNIFVAGDGETDRISALETGCRFFHISGTNSLIELLGNTERFFE